MVNYGLPVFYLYLMIAYLLSEEKAKEFNFYNNETNVLLESAGALYMESWNAFSKGKKVKENNK